MKRPRFCPGRVVELGGASSCAPKVSGSIPSQGTHLGCRFDPQSGRVWEMASVSLIDVYLSLKSMNISSGEDKKKEAWILCPALLCHPEQVTYPL